MKIDSGCKATEGYNNGSRGCLPFPPRARVDELASGPREQSPRRVLEQLKHTVSFVCRQRTWND